MRRALFCVVLAVIPSVVAAQEAQDCQAAGGTLLTGTVQSPPQYKKGAEHPHGVELSHSHVRLRSDQDGQSYDVAIDNVFAAGYDDAGARVPAPLSTIKVGDHLELCGKLYTTGVGMDWVHTNCDEPATPAHPDGWLKIVGADGTLSGNLEDARKYCGIFD